MYLAISLLCSLLSIWPFASGGGHKEQNTWSVGYRQMITSSVVFLCGTSTNEGDLVPSCFEPGYYATASTFKLHLHIWRLILVGGSQACHRNLHS